MAVAGIEQSNLSQEDLTKFCDPCTYRRVQKQAGTYCQECSEYLCDFCADLHRSFKATREHELKSLNESSTLTVEQKALVSALMTCDDHSSETYTDFCFDHDLLICNLCKIVTHRKCEIKSLIELAGDKKTQTDIKESLEKTKALLTEFEHIKELRDIDKAKVQSTSTAARKEIGEIKEEIITWAGKQERCSLAKLEETEKALIEEISTHVRISDEMVKQLTKVITSFETLGQGIPVASFALLKKVKAQIIRGEKANDEVTKEMKCQSIEFRKSTKLTTLMNDISEMGEIFKFQDKTNFLGLHSLQTLPNFTVDTQGVTGSTVLPNNGLVICDNNTVKVFTPDFVLKNELDFDTRVMDVAAVSNDEVIVTQTDSKMLQFLDLSDGMTKTKSIPVQQICWGVDLKNDKIYTTCYPNNNTGGEIKVLTRDGSSVQTITVDQGRPYYLSVNSTGDKIAVCTCTSTVLCFHSTGHLLYTYFDSQLNCSVGLLFDSYDNLLVCGRLSNNIHVIRSDGTRHQIILNSKIKKPYCLTYSLSSRNLIVGQRAASDPLLAISIK